jgi:ABC-type lipoprotein export system ATPase subunit
MTVEFKTIMPIPLREINHNEKSIWGTSFCIEEGKKILLNASSGKGKSTFTNITYGIRNDYAGEIIIDGKNSKSLSLDEWTNIRQNKMSVIFQDLQLFPSYTVRENLMLKQQLGSRYSEMELIQFLERLGIDDKWNQQCGILSLGQQQRVAIIRALIQPFELLIMDEPFSHLDEQNTHLAFELINEIADSNKAGYVLTTLGDQYGFNFDYELNL